MRNMKFVIIFAACGFVLSFVFGLFSHSSFLFILIKALVSGAIFVGLGVLISFIFKKFLLDSNSFDTEPEDSPDLSQKVTDNTQKPGQIIDIVVQDEELTPSESDNHFVVGNKHQMLKGTDISKGSSKDSKAAASECTPQSSDFVPMKGFETVSSSVNKSSKSVDSSAKTPEPEVSAAKNEDTFSEEDLDTLPDMDNFNLVEDGDSLNNESDSYSDPDLEPSASSYKKSSISVPEVKDAALIARAISTALSEEN